MTGLETLRTPIALKTLTMLGFNMHLILVYRLVGQTQRKKIEVSLLSLPSNTSVSYHCDE